MFIFVSFVIKFGNICLVLKIILYLIMRDYSWISKILILHYILLFWNIRINLFISLYNIFKITLSSFILVLMLSWKCPERIELCFWKIWSIVALKSFRKIWIVGCLSIIYLKIFLLKAKINSLSNCFKQSLILN